MRNVFVYLNILCLGAGLCAAGCVEVIRLSPPQAAHPSQQESQDDRWKNLASGIEHRFLPTAQKQVKMSLYRFAAESFVLEFQHATGTGNVADWHRAYPEALLISNGGYFNEDAMPSGFLKINGTVISSRRFDLDKSALVVGGRHPRFVDTAMQAFPEQEPDLLQSYPTLIKEGKQAVQADSGKRARRTFIGFDKQGRLYVGNVSEGDLSLFELAQSLTQADIDWQDVLNLDGGPSTGLSARIGEWEELKNSWTSVPNIVMVKRK